MPTNPNLTLTQRPETNTVLGKELSLDPVNTATWFAFASRVIASADDAQAFINIPDTATLPDGSTVTVVGQVFTAEDNTSESEFISTDVSTGSGTSASVARQITAESIAAAINANGSIGPEYTAQVGTYVGGSLVLFIANTNGTPFDLTGLVTFSGTTGVTFTVTATGTDGDRAMELQEYQYGAFCQLMLVPGEITFDNTTTVAALKQQSLQIQQLSARYGGVNRFAFDVGKFIAPECTLPDAEADFGYWSFAAMFVRAYWVRYGESFDGGYVRTGANAEDYGPSTTGGPVKDYYTGETGIRWAFPAAFSNAEVPAATAAWWQLWNSAGVHIGIGIRLMSEAFQYNVLNIPIVMKLRRRVDNDLSEPVGVFLWNNSANTPTCRLRTIFTMMDGSTNTQILGTSFVANDGVHIVDVRNTRVGLQLAEAATGLRVRWWDMTVQMSVNSDGTYVDVAHGYYWLDDSYNPEGYRKLIWRNRYGVFDCFEFDCLAVFDNPVENETYQRSLVNTTGDNRSKPQIQPLATVSRRRVTLSSGWVRLGMMEFLRSLIESPQIWEDVGGALVAMSRVEQSWEVDENEQQYQLTITLEESEVRNIIQP